MHHLVTMLPVMEIHFAPFLARHWKPKSFGILPSSPSLLHLRGLPTADQIAAYTTDGSEAVQKQTYEMLNKFSNCILK
jgi:hypothetical protein